MTISSSFSHSIVSSKIGQSRLRIRRQQNVRLNQKFSFAIKSSSTELFGPQFNSVEADLIIDWSFTGGSRISIRPKKPTTSVSHAEGFEVIASWFTSSQIATGVFTLGTAAVLPFYTLMVLAPKAELTRKSMQSNTPYVVLGILYAYLLYLSWTPDTLHLMFASKYWLPELPGIAKMFSNEMTLASAWIHLLAVDLFAARQVFHDGVENQIETRHSVSLCLLFCPIGIITHVITKAVAGKSRSTKRGT